MNNKKYLNTNQKVEYLKNKKKIIVSDKERICFEERNYISLINPYKEIFASNKDNKGNHIYYSETKFSDILKIIKYDELASEKLYKYISSFEKEYKNVLFENICQKYSNDKVCDYCCISYINEIRIFISRLKIFRKIPINSKLSFLLPNPPIFCKNFYYMLNNNGYSVDKYHIESKMELLEKIADIGEGKDKYGKRISQTNMLIKHYCDNYKTTPLWAIPNALTLGELNILFGMLDKETQRVIASSLLKIDEIKIDSKKLMSFSGMLEKIREIRNVINHYEPLYSYLLKMTNNKAVKDSQIYKAIDFLKEHYSVSYFSLIEADDLSLNENDYNRNKIKVLEIMKNISK